MISTIKKGTGVERRGAIFSKKILSKKILSKKKDSNSGCTNRK